MCISISPFLLHSNENYAFFFSYFDLIKKKNVYSDFDKIELT